MIELYTIPGCVWPRRQTVLPIDLSHQQFQRMQLSDRALFQIIPAEVFGSASVYSWWGICLRPKNKRNCSDYTKCFLCWHLFGFCFFLQSSCMSTNVQQNDAEQLNKCVAAWHGCNFRWRHCFSRQAWSKCTVRYVLLFRAKFQQECSIQSA